MKYMIYKFRVNENGEVISCCMSRNYKTEEEALKHFNVYKNADFVNYEKEYTIVKRNGKIVKVDTEF